MYQVVYPWKGYEQSEQIIAPVSKKPKLSGQWEQNKGTCQLALFIEI